MYRLDDYDYHLPERLIAQTPAPDRDGSRLLHLNRRDGNIVHRQFNDIVSLLHPTDVLVVNDTRVVPVRLYGRKDTGGKVELLILNYGEADGSPQDRQRVLRCLIKASKPLRPSTRLFFEEGLEAQVIDSSDGIYSVRFWTPDAFDQLLDRIGRMPLPPYIKRDLSHRDDSDRNRYQTVYARERGAIAAPTAGLHFTDEIVARIKAIGVTVVTVTLHVGYGTFVPVRVDDIRDHRMHDERFHIPDETVRIVNRAKSAGQRVVAVGTTSVRTLEYAARGDGCLPAGAGRCDLFIFPGYQFKIVDALLTNFHLPRSTLLMLVSAFAGRETILSAYHAAVAAEYRFFSYGDAMLIE
ncbi:MAG: tRNA preQ1(34) S-adenosylmethionine ribosyltransferase-isomerase QueA [Desulfosarcina sp.]|jgi:S-adenosylmethionine:tRNA ribosyltransferase-isomerase